LSRYGYYSDDGDWIETPKINNLVFLPENNGHSIYCTICGRYTRVLPTNKDLPVLGHQCGCRCIPYYALLACYNKNRQLIIQSNHLKTLEIDTKSGVVTALISNLWIGDSRLSSKRREIGSTQRREIINDLADRIMAELNISFEDFPQYFNTGDN
jgi:hypothetical protein